MIFRIWLRDCEHAERKPTRSSITLHVLFAAMLTLCLLPSHLWVDWSLTKLKNFWLASTSIFVFQKRNTYRCTEDLWSWPLSGSGYVNFYKKNAPFFSESSNRLKRFQTVLKLLEIESRDHFRSISCSGSFYNSIWAQRRTVWKKLDQDWHSKHGDQLLSNIEDMIGIWCQIRITTEFFQTVLPLSSDRVIETSAAWYRTEIISTFDFQQFQDRLEAPWGDLKTLKKMGHFFVKIDISRPWDPLCRRSSQRCRPAAPDIPDSKSTNIFFEKWDDFLNFRSG